MKMPSSIQILEGDSVAIFKRIAAFLSSDQDEPTAFVRQGILADRGAAPNYRFHQAMRVALEDPLADLIDYTGTTGVCYAAWSPSPSGDEARVAILPRQKSSTGLVSDEVISI